MANDKSPFRNIRPFIPRIPLSGVSSPPGLSVDLTQVNTPIQSLHNNRNIHPENKTPVSTLPPLFPIASRVLTHGAWRILGLPLESEAVTTESKPTSLEHTYPNVEIFYKIRAENPDLTLAEAYNQFVVGGGRPPSPLGSSNGSGSNSSEFEPEEESEDDMADNLARDPPVVHN